jgi:hypothetical protein
MAAQAEHLLDITHELERTLNEAHARPDWKERLEDVLARAEDVARRQGAELMNPEGILNETDRPRLPSPAVDRKVGGLRRELAQILEEIHALRTAVPAAEAVLSDDLLRRGRKLVASLGRYRNAETHVVMGSVNLDLGAGD